MKVKEMLQYKIEGTNLKVTFEIRKDLDLSQIPEVIEDWNKPGNIADDVKSHIERAFRRKLIEIAVQVIKEEGRTQDHLFPELGCYLETPSSDENEVMTLIHPKLMYEKLKEMFG